MFQIQAKNISASYSEKKILNNVSFGIKKGQVLAIIGESGQGKSTLLSLLAGLLQPDSGEILIENQLLEGPLGKLIAGHHEIKLVAQDYRLNPNFTIRENIAYSLRSYTKAFQNERVNELLTALGITDIQDKLPKYTSGGEKQRTAIAKAIADVPKVLLLDEPFSNLDNINRQKLKKSLSQLIKNEGIACLFVTHDLLDAIEFADEIGFIQNAEIIEIMSSEKIKNYTGNDYIETFINASFESIWRFIKN